MPKTLKSHKFKFHCLNFALFGVTTLCLVTVGCNENAPQFQALEQQMSGLSKKLDVIDEHLAIEGSGPEDPNANTVQDNSRLARELLNADQTQKQQIVEQYVEKASSFDKVKSTNVEKIVTCMESLTTIMSHSDLSAEQMKSAEDAQNQLVKVLANGVTKEIESLDNQAMATDDFRLAQKLWTEAATLLEYFPSTNDPIAEQKFELIATAHQEVAGRIRGKQIQKYNKWACSQIKEANRLLPGQTPSEIVVSCVKFLGPIDPNLLEPLSLDIYSKFLGDVREKLPLATYYTMGEQVSIVPRKQIDEIDLESTKN